PMVFRLPAPFRYTFPGLLCAFPTLPAVSSLRAPLAVWRPFCGLRLDQPLPRSRQSFATHTRYTVAPSTTRLSIKPPSPWTPSAFPSCDSIFAVRDSAPDHTTAARASRVTSKPQSIFLPRNFRTSPCFSPVLVSEVGLASASAAPILVLPI